MDRPKSNITVDYSAFRMSRNVSTEIFVFVSKTASTYSKIYIGHKTRLTFKLFIRSTPCTIMYC
jgi:hypothetical protein